jgi:hypothetical protein
MLERTLGTFLVIAAIPLLTACPRAVTVTVTVSPTEVALPAGGSQAFTAIVTGTIDTAVDWATTAGTITGTGSTVSYTAPVAAGSFEVTATSRADPTRSASARVIVSEVEIMLDPAMATLATGESRAFTATVTGAIDTGVSWTTTGGTITGTGATITYTAPAAAGAHEITATSQADSDKTATATITVTASESPAVLGVTIDVDQLTLTAGDSDALTATVEAVGGASTAVEWRSTGPSVASVDGVGVVTAHSPGVAQITATSTHDGTKTDTVTATVIAAAYASRAGGGSPAYGLAVSALDDGSAVLTGYFAGTAFFGPSTVTSAGSFDAFVAKIDPNGTWQWATRAGGTANDQSRSVTALHDGSAIVAGNFGGTASFGAATLTSAGSMDAFVAKVGADGTWQWATRAGGTEQVEGRSVSALPDGSAIITGHFEGTATFGATTLTSTGGDDGFVAKIDADGTWEWATRAGGSSSARSLSVSALGDGSAIVTGFFHGTASFGTTSITSAGGSDAFIAKVGADGSWQWVTRAGGANHVGGQSVSALSDGGAVLVGRFQGTASFGGTVLTTAAVVDVFAAKVGADGAWQWATHSGVTSYAYGEAVSALADGSAILTGYFGGTAAFGTTPVTSAGGSDAFIAKTDANGTWQWAARAGGANSAEGRSVSSLGDGSAILTGYFQGVAAFGPTSLISSGGSDAFAAKINRSGGW